ncbi:uncharacterized protein I303_100882 [Kwoniella dejecticola CBS 10117]|uniref:C2H2-type domain-containing protein n=1 Tax=Kwoniella dejecticola CBS 10117 TaxID=1296121 RepID=A0A1A6AGA8_9TREE|nr:uncharacterized protein I303_00885 [Kwoniella dejecticola CBS 10117]OBR89063.1 hypothetical protein I303_00885 [Kwoniella dejecticola CBS 10117]
MQQYMPSTTPLGSPHYAHNDPWAHALICCDQDHGASSSNSNQINQIGFPQQQQQIQHQHSSSISGSASLQQEMFSQTPPNGFTQAQGSNQPQAGRCAECSAECPLEAYCCGGDYCCDGAHGCDKSESTECCADPTCEETLKEPCHEEHPFHPPGHCGDAAHNHDQDMKSLEEWADTKEGCHAIQQLLECCNQPNCDIPVCPTENETVHPPAPDPLAAIFGSMMAQPIEPSPSTGGPSSAIETISHTCHWGNCHLVFKSMPDLLAHVAADHLSAWGAGSGPKSTDPAQTQIMTPTVPQPQQMPSSMAQTSFAATPPLQLASNVPNGLGINSAFPTPQGTETDQLLSCLWDDCFPMTDMPSAMGETFPQSDNTNTQPLAQQIPHAHSHAHPHPHAHDHTTATGEPFSPGTMLRHVLEEHLGVPGSIIGWPTETAMGQQVDKNHHHHHVDPHHLAHHHDHLHGHNHPHHHHGHSHSHSMSLHHPFPTPPSTVSTQLSTSPAPVGGSSMTAISTNSSSSSANAIKPNGNGLICLWPGCPIDHVFQDSASLMDHLSEVHIPKGKDSYTCHWDNCGDGQGRTFKSRQKVLRHLQSHTGHKPFVCGVCDQAFSEAAPLSAHMRRHAQQKPFKCEYPGCGKTFAVSSSLTIHMRTHNGEKPYICPHCGRGFVEASNLTKHIRTHTGERPFHCAHPGCGKKFSRPDQLKRHMLVHDKPHGQHARRRSSAQTAKSEGSAMPAPSHISQAEKQGAGAIITSA